MSKQEELDKIAREYAIPAHWISGKSAPDEARKAAKRYRDVVNKRIRARDAKERQEAITELDRLIEMYTAAMQETPLNQDDIKSTARCLIAYREVLLTYPYTTP